MNSYSLYKRGVFLLILCSSGILFTQCSVNNSTESTFEIKDLSPVERHIQELQKKQQEEYDSLIETFEQGILPVTSTARAKMQEIHAIGYTIEEIDLPAESYPVAFNNLGSLVAALPHASRDYVYWNSEQGAINIKDWIENHYTSDRGVSLGLLSSSSLNNKDEVATGARLYFRGGPEYAPIIWSPDNGLQVIHEMANVNPSNIYERMVEISAINDESELFGHQYINYAAIGRAIYWNQEDGMINDPSWPALRILHANNDRLTSGLHYNNFRPSESFLLNMNTGETKPLNDLGSNARQFNPKRITNSGKIFGHFFYSENNITERRYGYLANDELLMYEKPEGTTYHMVQAMNEEGKAVGFVQRGNGNEAVIWDADGSYEILNVGSPAGLFLINDHNQMIAWIQKDGDLILHLLTPNEAIDATPPEITFTQHTERLWPPNHKMETVLTGITATDNLDPNPEVSVRVYSNEAENGKGDGNTETDWEITQADDGTYQVALRAERSGNSTGRVYTVVITATDASGNVAETQVIASVARNHSIVAREK